MHVDLPMWAIIAASIVCLYLLIWIFWTGK